MFQFAVSDGEGTLLAHGVLSYSEIFEQNKLQWAASHTLIIEACARDCQTGK